MSIKTNSSGIIGNEFSLGKNDDVKIVNNSGILEVKNGSDLAAVRVKELASSPNLNDAVALLNLKGNVALIEFSFAGASAPSAGTNTSKFGFCHTTGGSYTAGDVVYDDGTALYKMSVVSAIMTSTAVTGTISLVANGFYAKQSGSWVLKGDGSGASVGVAKVVKLSLSYNSSSTVDSTTSIPEGAKIIRSEVVVNTAFNGTAPTLAVSINGGTPLTIMSNLELNLKSANQYESMNIYSVGSANAGTIRLSYSADSSSAGSADIYVFYAEPLS